MRLPWRNPLPTCRGTWDGWEPDFDCPAPNGGDGCEEFLCNYHTCGGLKDPDTGKSISRFVAWLKYGPRRPEE